MDNNAKKENSINPLIILLLVIILLLIAVVVAVLLRGKTDNTNTAEVPFTTEAPFSLSYDNGAVVIDQDEFEKRVSEMYKQAEEGYIDLTFQAEAFSSDGENFTCKIANAETNNYDMYIDIYKDDACTEQLYISGLLAPGTEIKQFKSKQKLALGDYEALLVLTQIEDDHKTIHSQTSVYLTLHVR